MLINTRDQQRLPVRFTCTVLRDPGIRVLPALATVGHPQSCSTEFSAGLGPLMASLRTSAPLVHPWVMGATPQSGRVPPHAMAVLDLSARCASSPLIPIPWKERHHGSPLHNSAS